LAADFVGLVESMKKAAIGAVDASKPVNLVFGTVTSVNPIKINIEQKITLEAPQLVLARNVTEYDVEMTVAHYTNNIACVDPDEHQVPYEPGNHHHPYSGRKVFKVHLGLEVGEKVILIRMQGGDKFVVIDRVGG
jgi:hypothetical protein